MTLSKLAKQRRLNIIDAVEGHPLQSKRAVEIMRADARTAHRFVLGDEASYAVGHWITGCEDILLDNRQFARPPFPSTYVELTIREVHRAMGRLTGAPDTTTDDRLGFLIKDGYIRTCATAVHLPRPVVGAFEYWPDTPDPTRIMDGPVTREDAYRMALLLGSSSHALKDDAQCEALVRGTRIRMTLPSALLNERTRDSAGNLTTRRAVMISAAAGEMRTLWAVLLLINQHRDKLHFNAMPREIGITPKGRRVYMAHTLVGIPLHAPTEARRIFYPSLRSSPVAHEVRGHWMHLHLRPGCEHFWPTMPDEDGHFICARCQGLRTWRKPHHRGDASRGFNKTDYEVTP